MNAFVKAILAVMVITWLAGCNDEIGGGSNIGPTTQQERLMKDNGDQEMYGEVMHRGTVVPSEKVKVVGQDITETLSSVTIVSIGTNAKPGTLAVLGCDTRTGTWALATNIYQDNGKTTQTASEFSIFNYPAGMTIIREVDDSARAYFATGDGDTDILKAYKGFAKLDPNSTIAFAVEEVRDDGLRYTIGWSPLFKVKDVVNGLKKVSLAKCEKVDIDDPFLGFISNEQLREAVQQ